MSDAPSGQLLAGRYRLLETIGRGGMGTVWRAEDELLGRHVAVKRLRVPHGMDEEELATLCERTRREARGAARINHPNVVVVHDVVEDDGMPCIVMEYVPSRTLGEVLAAEGPLAPDEAARVGRGMIAALRAAHAAGVLHRDVKPGNVLLGHDGRVVLTDFGIARLAGHSTLTKTGEMVGSIDYIAPERVRGGGPAPAADLWALGATLYEAVEGRPPFRRDTAVETAYAIAVDPLTPPRSAGELTRLIETLMTRDPALRPPAELVERILGDVGSVPGAAVANGRVYGSASGAESGAMTAPVTAVGHAPEPDPGTVHDSVGPASGPGASGGPSGPEEPTAVVTAPGPRTVPAAVPPGTGPGTGRPAARRGRFRRWAVVGGAVGVLLAAMAAYVLVPGGDRDDDAAPAPRTSTTATTAREPSPSRPSEPAVPHGYHWVEEKRLGVGLPVPDGWRRKEKSAVEVDYIDPTGRVDLKVNVLDLASPDPLRHWEDVERDLRTRLTGYRRLRMQATAYRGGPAAVWEFSFTGRARQYRAIDLGFGRAGGDEYAVYVSAPAEQWDRYRPVFDAVRDGLRVTGRG
ncbi:serine/threonine-protein kinase [Streptomyces luteireticuli]